MLTKQAYKKRLKRIQARNQEIEMRLSLRNERNKFRKEYSLNTSTKVLIASIVAIIAFTVCCLFIQYVTHVEVSSMLIEKWYAFWTVEIVVLAGIKVTKVFKDRPSTTGCNCDVDNSSDSLDVEDEQ